MLKSAINAIRAARAQPRPKSAAARRELDADRAGLLGVDHGNQACIEAALGWLSRAQDHTASADGGVARGYHLDTGWQPSYPETTGYIVPTFIEQGVRLGRPELVDRARRMLSWLVEIQLPEGGFQGGVIGSVPRQPVAFNTGQILLGLAAGEKHFGGYRAALTAAADWLVRIQSVDGAWAQFTSPFATPGAKAFDTHIAWGLLAADSVAPGRGYVEAAVANMHWAIERQNAVGWFDECCLSDAAQPLTHTLGYALRGLLEGYLYTHDRQLLQATEKTARGLLGALGDDGFLPGLLRPDWQPAADWACLTGTVQIAYCWLKLHQQQSDTRLLEAGRRANRFVRRTMRIAGPAETVGAVKGSAPVDGLYNSFQYPNWAAKFAIDSFTLEQALSS